MGFESFDADPREDVALGTSIWYPTTSSESAAIYSWGGWNYKSPFVGVSASREPPDASFPLLVMSAGLGGSGMQFAPLAEALASHGYVVAAPNHTTQDLAPRAEEQLLAMETLIARSSDPTDWMHGLVNSDAIALGGFSWGSPTTQHAVRSTEREIGAVLMLDGTLGYVDDTPALHVGGGAYTLPDVRYRFGNSDFYSLDIGAASPNAKARHGSFVLNRCQLHDEVVKAAVLAGTSKDEASSRVGSECSGSLLPGDVQERTNAHALSFLNTTLKQQSGLNHSLAPAYATTESDLWVRVEIDAPASFLGTSVLLTDPEGRSVGVDPTTGLFTNEFGEAMLGEANVAQQNTFVGIERGALLAGEYRLEAVATTTRVPRDYTVYLGAAHNRGDDVVYSRQVLATGTVAPGDAIVPITFQVTDPFSHVDDINDLLLATRSQDSTLKYDLNFDNRLDELDVIVWTERVGNTYVGDSNLDGQFNSSDFVQIFERGQYHDGIRNNARWEDGDWNGDGEFSSRDFVFAMIVGGYENGPRSAQSVPEPIGNGWIWLAVAAVGRFARRRLQG